MPRLRAAVLALTLVPSCSPSIQADERDADKPVVIVAAKDAQGVEIPPAPAPTVAPPRPTTPLVSPTAAPAVNSGLSTTGDKGLSVIPKPSAAPSAKAP